MPRGDDDESDEHHAVTLSSRSLKLTFSYYHALLAQINISSLD